MLRDGGRFVFSVNVPEPNWLRVAAGGLPGVLRAPRPLRYLRNALRMLRYGAWLKREARTGRFHYLPAVALTDKLTAAGFRHVEHRVSFAGQAFVFRCRKNASRRLRLCILCNAASGIARYPPHRRCDRQTPSRLL